MKKTLLYFILALVAISATSCINNKQNGDNEAQPLTIDSSLVQHSEIMTDALIIDNYNGQLTAKFNPAKLAEYGFYNPQNTGADSIIDKMILENIATKCPKCLGFHCANPGGDVNPTICAVMSDSTVEILNIYSALKYGWWTAGPINGLTSIVSIRDEETTENGEDSNMPIAYDKNGKRHDILKIFPTYDIVHHDTKYLNGESVHSLVITEDNRIILTIDASDGRSTERFAGAIEPQNVDFDGGICEFNYVINEHSVNGTSNDVSADMHGSIVVKNIYDDEQNFNTITVKEGQLPFGTPAADGSIEYRWKNY